MGEEAKQGPTSSKEQRGQLSACCREMAEKMGDCGAMMARFMEMMKPDAPSADEPKPKDG
jgi:hypothetical protein